MSKPTTFREGHLGNDSDPEASADILKVVLRIANILVRKTVRVVDVVRWVSWDSSAGVNSLAYGVRAGCNDLQGNVRGYGGIVFISCIQSSSCSSNYDAVASRPIC